MRLAACRAKGGGGWLGQGGLRLAARGGSPGRTRAFPPWPAPGRDSVAPSAARRPAPWRRLAGLARTLEGREEAWGWREGGLEGDKEIKLRERGAG